MKCMKKELIKYIIAEFNRQLKDCQEAHRKDLQTLQATIEELKRRDECMKNKLNSLNVVKKCKETNLIILKLTWKNSKGSK